MCVTVIPVRVSRPPAFRRRFNARKANRSGYATDIDILIDEVDPTPENYGRFVEAIRVASKNIYQGAVEDTTFLVYLKNQRAYMRHTINST